MTDGSPRLYDSLTRRELEILALLAERLSDREIAERLVIGLTTVKWYNRQIFNKLGVENRRQAIDRARLLGLLEMPAASKHNLPTQITPFVAREHELSELARLLYDDDVRLLTILAPGGMGKTRLALAAAEANLSHFANGVYFVPLAPLTSAEHIVPTIAENVGFQFSPGSRALQEQLLDFLKRKSLLLILDNFEHLLDGAALISDILQVAPAVKVITTSRERLNLMAETVYTLGGMAYPEQDDLEYALDYGAVQLFVQCARRAQPRFVLNGESDNVVRVCRMLHGMPLAIELAAVWIGALSVQEIAQEISHSLDFLRTNLRDVPERLRSVRAVFESAWQRLTEAERSVFCRLSVFRGGCTREAVQAVTGSDLETLTRLVDKALLWRNPSNERYEIHELLRQYAEQELEANHEADAAGDMHLAYYARIAYQWSRALKTPEQLAAVTALETDIENIRQAFTRAVDQSNLDMLEAFSNMWYFYDIQGRWMEGEKALGAAIDMVKHQESVLLGRLLAGRALLLGRLGMIDTAGSCSEQSLAILDRCSAPEEMILPLLALGDVVEVRQGLVSRKPMSLEALRLARQYDDQWGIACALYTLGNVAFYEQDYPLATDLLQQSYKVMKATGSLWGMSWVTSALAYDAYCTECYEEAERLYRDSLATARLIGNQFIIARSLIGLGTVALAQGQFARAAAFVEDGLKIQQDTGVSQLEPGTPALLGEIACARGDFQSAILHFLEALKIARESSITLNAIAVLLDVANLFVQAGQQDRAVELLALIWQHTPNVHIFGPVKAKWLESISGQLRTELSTEAYQVAWEHGQSLNLEDVVAGLVGETPQSRWTLVRYAIG